MPSHFIYNNDKIQHDQDVANKFNSYFKSVSHSASVDSNASSNNNQQYKHTHYLKKKNPVLSSFFFKPITEHELIETSKSLNNTNSTGFDNISCIVMKQIIHVIVKLLVHIFNVSFSTGIFPSNLKIAKVIPVFKKGDQHLFENYRPISLLPCFSKLIEKYATNRLYSFLSKKHILSDFQFGFRPNHCTAHAMKNLQDKVRSSIEKKYFVWLFLWTCLLLLTLLIIPFFCLSFIIMVFVGHP